MEPFSDSPLIQSVPGRCRTCYVCVRECPAKAIRIRGGEATVVEERCVGCGNCVTVCSQGAKQFRRCTEKVKAQLERGGHVAACLAPSFPAEFPGVAASRVVGMVRALGFTSVHEVGFGADLVAERYRRLVEEKADDRRWIATTCPSVAGYVERYRPELVPRLAPIVSPMVATARALRRLHGPDLLVVFVGPCLAKKREALSPAIAGDVWAVLTFIELHEMLAERGLSPARVEPAEFDPPRAGKGALFPIRRGLLEAARLDEGLASGAVVSVDGREDVFEAIDEYAHGWEEPRLLEGLACHGCLMGPGATTHAPVFSRQASVARYVRAQRATFNLRAWKADLERFADLDLSRRFKPFDQRLVEPTEEQIREIMERMGKTRPEDELDCGACGYRSCRAQAHAVHAGLAEREMCLPGLVEHLRRTLSELARSNEELASAQEALTHAEKLASLGQLAAGIAHEVNNPLGVVLMYAHLLLDACTEDGTTRDDLRMIAEQAERCKRIVAGLLDFSRQNRAILQPADLHDIVLRAANAVPRPAGVRLDLVQDGDPIAEVDRDQLAQVVTNLVGNAYDAMPGGGTLTLRTGGDAGRVHLEVRDTGTGIPPAHLAKIYEPFFTTKPMGKGTGLGLAVTYGIVKIHRGDIRVASNADPGQGPTGTTFTVSLPRHTEQVRP